MNWVGWALVVLIAWAALMVAILYLMTEYECDRERRRRK